ncbi:MAG: hypothetical protein ACRDV6_09345 [Acidimicrobiales bacterium]
MIYHLEDARAVRALSRARDAGQAAMGMVIGLVLLITLSAGTLAATAIQHDPLVSADVVQHLAYRALQSGIDSYLAALNQNPNLVNCNSANTSSSSTACPAAQLPALNQWETVVGNTNNPVTEKFMWTNPWLCFNSACTAAGSTAGQTLSYVKELVYGFAENGKTISFQSSFVNVVPENGFLDSLFWSNFESTDPALSSNPNASADCTYDWNNSYQGPDTTSPNNYNSSNCGAVYFGPHDTLDGPVYSNDSIYVASNPNFGTSSNPSTVTTHDPNCLFVAPGDGHGSSTTCSGATADVGTYNSTTSSDNAQLEPIPTTDTALATIAAQNGCLYSGPTTITLSNSGSTEMMTVNSPDTPYTVGTSTTYNASSGTDQNNNAANTNTCTAGGSAIPVPTDGVIYVQTATSSQQTATGCASSTLSNPPQNPFMGDNSSGQYSQDGFYDGETSIPNCEGDAFVQGGVKGALTIATQNDVIIDGNITYSIADCGGSFNSTYTGQCGYQSSATSNDALGLIAFSFVEVDRPVTDSSGTVTVNATCGGSGALPVPYCDPGGSGLTIDAALLALNDSFAVNNYTQGGADGALQVYGSIAQDYRGAVGTFSGNSISTGYSKSYVWDSRLGYVNVPNYLNPGTPRWGVASTAVDQGVACTTSTQLPGPWLSTSDYSSPNLANSPGNCDSVSGHP